MNQKLRIGILLDDYSIPAWKYKILKDIGDSGLADFVIVIRSKSATIGATDNQHALAYFILSALGKTDRLLFKSKKDYDSKSDVSDLLKDVPVFTIENNFSEVNILKNEVDKISEFGLDIILKFGSHELGGEIKKISKYGIWSYSIDDKDLHGFWEVIKGYFVSSSSLLVHDESTGQQKVIFNSLEATCPYSMEVNRNHLFWRSSLFIPRILSSLHEFGDSFFERQLIKFQSVKTRDTISSQAVNLNTALTAVCKYFVTGIKTALKKIFYTDAFNWHLIFDYKDKGNALLTDLNTFRTLKSPKGIFWADPFVVANGDNYYFFVEEFLHKINKAHISVLELDKKGNLKDTVRIIERPYHLSYPFIFKIDSTYYMIPETCKNKTIELYKCEDFPYKWKFERNIMEDLLAVDTSLFYYNNKWWLFTSIDQTDNISGTSTELFLFFSDDFHSGSWKSHPQNPIVSDVRKARSAGKLFIFGGKIYRPSQDCSGRYGRGFKLNEIVKLTENEYYEDVFLEVEPVWNKRLKGTHTYNFEKDLTVADVYSYRTRLMG